MRRICATVAAAVVALSVWSCELRGQTSDTRGLGDRIDKLEAKIVSLEKNIAELNGLLRALLPPPPVQEVAAVEMNIANAAVKGSASAKIALIEFSDFECPYCGRHAQTTYRQLQKQFVDSGRVKYVFRHLPLVKIHPNATKAAEAAECAGEQGKFWEMHDRLFANQKTLTVPDLEGHAQAVGLDAGRFKGCLSEGRMASKVTADIAEAERLGLTATPGFVLGEIVGNNLVRVTRRISGAHPYAVFQSAIEQVAPQP
jgi:protein-disulfide isomerase